MTGNPDPVLPLIEHLLETHMDRLDVRGCFHVAQARRSDGVLVGWQVGFTEPRSEMLDEVLGMTCSALDHPLRRSRFDVFGVVTLGTAPYYRVLLRGTEQARRIHYDDGVPVLRVPEGWDLPPEPQDAAT